MNKIYIFGMINFHLHTLICRSIIQFSAILTIIQNSNFEFHFYELVTEIMLFIYRH